MLNNYKKVNIFSSLTKHAVLILYSAICLFPILVILLNSFKSRAAIFSNPYMIPTADTFSTIGYETVFKRADFLTYYANSIIIVGISMFAILFFGSLVAFCVSEYSFKLRAVVSVYFTLGIIVPIRLGTVSILEIILGLNLQNTHLGLILIYIASGLPLAVLILTQFMEQVPKAIKEAARIEGANEFKIYLMTLPMVKTAVATVGAFSIIPIWNDVWFPLVMASDESVLTVTMGAQAFLGQFASDWNALLSALSMSIIPIILFYLVCSKNILKGVVDGAVKY